MKQLRNALVLVVYFIVRASSTSIKMDFLPFANVRTDPIISQTCLSDHVHTFFGAAIARPDLTYEDLRKTKKNSGNVKENKSLYWYPTVYRYDKASKIYTQDPIWFTSAYYIWETGKATAFPNDFRMIAGMRKSDKIRAEAECVGESPCERDDCSTNSKFFPASACEELEVSMSFPNCWDGVNRDSKNHFSHVRYTNDGEFDGKCPKGFPVRLPQIQLFFRIINYDGGQHMFSDGTSRFHADYISGWDDKFLQRVLDNCENDSFAAMPDAFCDDFLTFRDAPKIFDDKEDTDIVKALKPLQPKPPVDTSKITTESTNNIKKLPRGKCKGKLLTSQNTSSKNDPPIINKPESKPEEEEEEEEDEEEERTWDWMPSIFN